MSGYNFAALLVGDAECGKTTLARRFVRQFLVERPSGIVLAHDPVRHRKFGPRWWADGGAARQSIAQAVRDPRVELPRVLSIGGESSDVTELALEIGESSNTAERVTRPILVVYDEASMLSSGRTHIDKDEERALATRRHRGVGSITCAQQSTQIAAPYAYFSTELRVWQQPERSVRRLEMLFNRDEGELEMVRSLRRFVHVRVTRGAAR